MAHRDTQLKPRKITRPCDTAIKDVMSCTLTVDCSLSLPRQLQKLRCGALPEWGVARGASFGGKVGAEAELIDLGTGEQGICHRHSLLDRINCGRTGHH